MTSPINDLQDVEVTEVVVLSKFDGDSTDPADEVERVTIDNGYVVSHQKIENGEPVGEVEGTEDNPNLTGQDIGRFFPTG